MFLPLLKENPSSNLQFYPHSVSAIHKSTPLFPFHPEKMKSLKKKERHIRKISYSFLHDEYTLFSE